jgi:hypothetical protein
VAFEVFTPEQSAQSTQRSGLLVELQRRLRRVDADCRVEIDLADIGSPHDLDAIVKAVVSAESSEWRAVGTLGRVRRIKYGEPLKPLFDGDGPSVALAGQSECLTVLRMADDDPRVKLKVEEKRSQMDENVANVLVINVSAVGRIRSWPLLLADGLDNTFTKLGAVVFFDECISGHPVGVERRWRVLENPAVTHRIPKRLLSSFEAASSERSTRLFAR